MSARTLTELVAFVAETLEDAGDASPVLEGPEHLPSHETSAPRYVFLSLGASSLAEFAQRDDKTDPESLCSWLETVEVHIWAVDVDATATTAKVAHRDAAWMMRGNVMTALSEAFGEVGADFRPSSWEFVGQRDPRWSDHGSIIVLRFTMPVPEPRGIRPVVGVPTGNLDQSTVVIPSVTTTAAMQTSDDPDDDYEVEP